MKFKVGDIVCWRIWGQLVNPQSSHPNYGLIAGVYPNPKYTSMYNTGTVSEGAYSMIRRLVPGGDISKTDWLEIYYIESFVGRAYDHFWDSAEVELLKKKYLEFQMVEIVEK